MLKLGYKASAEQFGPRELLEFAVARRGARLRQRRRLRPLPAVAPRRRPRAVLVRPGSARAGERDGARSRSGTQRGDADATATTRRSSPRRWPRSAASYPGRVVPRRRHRRGDERGARSASSGPSRRSASRGSRRRSQLMQQLWARGARRLRRRVLPDRRTRRSTTGPSEPRAALHRGVRSRRRAARRAHRRRLHHARAARTRSSTPRSCCPPCARASRRPAASR